MRRLWTLLALLLLAAAAPVADFPVVRPGVPLAFPADHGAHPAYRTEWWYATGWLRTADGRNLGFQVTFFRSRLPVDPRNPSAFNPSQIVFAHAGLSDPATGRLLHDQRSARAGFGLAQAATGDAAVAIRDWTFRRTSAGRFETRIPAKDFTLALSLTPTQPPFAQGEAGYSRKGPNPADASRYYSVPHLKVAGTVLRGGRTVRVTGEAWLDREWSSSYLDPRAAGWDWTGLNLDDGSALMAFRIRAKSGGTLWAGGSLRRPDGRIVRFAPGDVALTPLRRWRSPGTGAVYPVEQLLAVRLPEGIRRYRLTPLFDAQELDARSGGLPVYWEGAVRTQGGRGYLELTGYVAPLAI
ncbi:lipocalin-like domain-containing protein [Sphingomonas prati]|uniref:Putative secreted hydrolase n=1 Tax=Sphingomonas prati TaxID=1843237 RepID=A0A7W9BUC0_9SPHN|nr:carotenoid 1,2-hydratase [Sphingomonas prati]MBB5730258.1 putative secreted hydrolase [Sphingomonas prati]GGE92730.1 carotenoid 1,2-hydratase [Sphingomonas prati]